MVLVLYASFLLTKEEMERNGVTSHQIIKFSYRRDPKTPAFARLLNVFETDLAKTLRDTQQGEDNVVCYSRIASRFDHQLLVKVFPREDVDVENDKLIFKTAQDEAYSVLLHILKTLKCEVTQELPDLRVLCVDAPSTWAMEIKRHEDNFIIKVQKLAAGYRCERGAVCTKIEGVELKSILFSLQHWRVEFEMRRLYNLSLDPVRNVEKFTCKRLNKTSIGVLCELKVMIELFSKVLG